MLGYWQNKLEIVPEIENTFPFQVGHHVVDYPTEPLTTHADPQRKLVKLIQPKEGIKGGHPLPPGSEWILKISIVCVQDRKLLKSVFNIRPKQIFRFTFLQPNTIWCPPPDLGTKIAGLAGCPGWPHLQHPGLLRPGETFTAVLSDDSETTAATARLRFACSASALSFSLNRRLFLRMSYHLFQLLIRGLGVAKMRHGPARRDTNSSGFNQQSLIR
jgi:hypothetical protein